MHLEMRYEPTGHVRPIWYGRFIIDGKKECVNLGVKLVGNPPASRKLKDKGDDRFEESRWKDDRTQPTTARATKRADNRTQRRDTENAPNERRPGDANA